MLKMCPSRSQLLLLFAFCFLSVSHVKSLRMRLQMQMQMRNQATVVGAGPAGLATSIMLARRGYEVKVYDRLPRPPSPSDEGYWSNFEEDRSYNLGLSSRGQLVLMDLEVMERVKSYSVDCVGSRGWSPQTEGDPPVVMTTGKTFPSRILQRDRLTGALLEEIESKYADAIDIHFKQKCIGAVWEDKETCKLSMQNIESNEIAEIVSKFVIGCDGASSQIREAMTKPDKIGSKVLNIKRYADRKNPLIYRTIPLYFPKDWRKDLNYSVRLKSNINLESLPTKSGVYLGVLIFKEDDERIKALASKGDTAKFFKEYFPMYWNENISAFKDEDLDKFWQKENSYFPKFSFVGPKLHRNNACLLGDCIHSVKPFFGLGANSAFEDIAYLNRSLDLYDDHIIPALEDYSIKRGPEAKNIVQISHRLDQGVLFFILPLILDSILHKTFPRIFSPNTLASLNNEERTFTQIRWRKRLDRVMQVGLGSGILLMVKKVIGLIYWQLCRRWLLAAPVV